MKSLLVLKHIKVQNANAISGLTWGFPSVSNFLGFTHALSRYLDEQLGLTLGGCGVVCHHHEVQALQPSGYGEYVFGLTRNPLTKEGNTAPFNEEGRMHLDLSLLIECNFTSDDLDFDTGIDQEDVAHFEELVTNKVYTMRLAGGTILNIQKVQFVQQSEDSTSRDRQHRRLMLSLLPGFLLVDRSPLLAEHFEALKEQNPNVQMVDAWLDFAALKFRSIATQYHDGRDPDDSTPAEWVHVEKPAPGWLVPITTGYHAISPLYEPGQVMHTRDARYPFCFVESTYSVGQWLSPHRVRDPDHIFWRYHQECGWYLCRNNYKPEIDQNLTAGE